MKALDAVESHVLLHTAPRTTGGTVEDQSTEKVTAETSSKLGPVLTESKGESR